MRLGVFQFKPERLNINANLQKISKAVSQFPDLDIIVFPELATSGYLFESKKELLSVAEKVPNGAISETLLSLSRKTDTLLVLGLPEREGKNVFNSAVAYFPDGSTLTYRKIHLFDREKFYFEPGDTKPRVFTYKSTRFGMMICFDWIFPELARSLALLGADVLLHLANLVLPWGQKAMQIRAIENHVYTATVNRFGKESIGETSLTFTGHSQIVAPNGKIIASADESEETMLVAEINPNLARNKRVTQNNDIFEDRRPDFYILK